MKDYQPSAAYKKIAEANREFYAKTAIQYDATETCVTDPAAQAEVEGTLDRILPLIGRPHAKILALDACGGSGNISLKLLKRNINVILADISPELQDIFRAKCRGLGLQPQTVCSEIGDFFARTEQQFDLIIFSSALHHLENIDEVLALAFGRLNPNGLLFTIFDPTSKRELSMISKILLRTEYYAFKIFCQTSDLPWAVGRRCSRILSGSKATDKSHVEINNATVGMLAEYHVDSGIDDVALAHRLQKVGYEVVWHERMAGARFAVTRRALNWWGDVTSFQLLLRKPAA